MESPDNSLPYLDVRMSVVNGKVGTGIYSKPEATFNYLSCKYIYIYNIYIYNI